MLELPAGAAAVALVPVGVLWPGVPEAPASLATASVARFRVDAVVDAFAVGCGRPPRGFGTGTTGGTRTAGTRMVGVFGTSEFDAPVSPVAELAGVGCPRRSDGVPLRTERAIACAAGVVADATCGASFETGADEADGLTFFGSGGATPSGPGPASRLGPVSVCSTSSKPSADSDGDDAVDDPAAGVANDAGGSGVEVREVKLLRNGTTDDGSY
jgi:hypothetical protein